MTKFYNGKPIKREVSKERIKQLKKEISKKASMANKRLKRLEKNGLQNSPSYRNWKEYGNGEKFSVKGKDYNQLQKELSRVNSFINAQTSTIRGTNKLLKGIAKESGLKYKKVSDLYAQTTNFFDLVSKVQQYMQNANMAGQTIGYQKIWQVVSEYSENGKVDLTKDVNNLDSIINELSNDIDSIYYEQMKEDNFNIFDL